MSSTSKRRQLSSSKRRACIKCVQGKRACDEQRPSCGRCAHLNKRCLYEDQTSSLASQSLVLLDANVSRQQTFSNRSSDYTTSLSLRRAALRHVSAATPRSPAPNPPDRIPHQGDSINHPAQALATHCLVQNTRLQPWNSLCNVRYTEDGQRYDLQRIFMGNLPVAEKQRARHQIEWYAIDQFYTTLEKARQARQIVHFARKIRSNEPVLRMDSALKKWSVASGSDETVHTDYCRLEVYEGELTSEFLEYYFRSAGSGPTTALIKMGLRYTELDLPSSDLIALSMMTNGVLANAASIVHTTNKFPPDHQIQWTNHSTFLSGSGNALLLIANEAELLRRLDCVIASGSIPEAYAIPVFTVLVCRRSQLLDHACFRACDGQYEAAKFFLHHANQISTLQDRLFGDVGPLGWDWTEDCRRPLIADDSELQQLLFEACQALDGMTSQAWLRRSLRSWPRKVTDTMKSIVRSC